MLHENQETKKPSCYWILNRIKVPTVISLTNRLLPSVTLTWNGTKSGSTALRQYSTKECTCTAKFILYRELLSIPEWPFYYLKRDRSTVILVLARTKNLDGMNHEVESMVISSENVSDPGDRELPRINRTVNLQIVQTLNTSRDKYTPWHCLTPKP